MTAFVLGATAGVAAFVVLLRLDPGPGPRRAAAPEEWRRHQERVRRARGGLLPLLLGGAIATSTLLAATDRLPEAAALGFMCGMIGVFVVAALARVWRLRRTPSGRS